MIRGIVKDREGIVRLSIFGRRVQRETVEAIVDTGYDGCLTLPPTMIRELELRWVSFGDATLADGSEIEFKVYDTNELQVRFVSAGLAPVERHLAATSLENSKTLPTRLVRVDECLRHQSTRTSRVGRGRVPHRVL